MRRTATIWLRKVIIRSAAKAITLALNVQGKIGLERLFLMENAPKSLGYLLCRSLPDSLIQAAIYNLSFNQRTGRLDFLQETSEETLSEARQRFAHIKSNIVGRCITWRNNQTRRRRSGYAPMAGKRFPLHVVAATRSWHFMKPLTDAIQEREEISIKEFDLRSIDVHHESKNRNAKYRKQAIKSLRLSAFFDSLSDWIEIESLNHDLQHDLRECDVLLVDWLNHNALWVLTHAPMDKKVIVRVHSYEVFSYFPLLLNMGRVDGLIFISHAIRDAFYENWGWLVPNGIHEIVLDNIRSLTRLQPSPSRIADRRFKLAMVQYGAPVKDVDFALSVIHHLRDRDSRFELLLVGNSPSSSGNPQSAEISRRIASFSGSVKELGYLTDIASLLSRVGFILSTSQREGSHESVIEGMALGCVPAIRNWPLLKRYDGAQRAFPGIDVWESPREMAEFIYRASVRFDDESASALQRSRSFFAESHVTGYVQFLRKVCSHA